MSLFSHTVVFRASLGLLLSSLLLRTEAATDESTNVEEASTVQPTATSIVHDDAPDHVAANTTEQTGDKGKQEEEENDKGLKCRMSSGQVSFKQTECAELQL